MPPGRLEIVAANENQFRAFNERLRAGAEDGTLEVLCECGVTSCRIPLCVGADHYAAVRAHPRRFLIAPGHELPEVETVVERGDGYRVVEKTAEVAHIIEPESHSAGGSERVEHLEGMLTYVWTSSDELEFADEGDLGRRLPVVHGLVMPLAREQGRRVRVTLREGVVTAWSPLA